MHPRPSASASSPFKLRSPPPSLKSPARRTRRPPFDKVASAVGRKNHQLPVPANDALQCRRSSCFRGAIPIWTPEAVLTFIDPVIWVVSKWTAHRPIATLASLRFRGRTAVECHKASSTSKRWAWCGDAPQGKIAAVAVNMRSLPQACAKSCENIWGPFWWDRVSTPGDVAKICREQEQWQKTGDPRLFL
jgi:hypothetical protein